MDDREVVAAIATGDPADIAVAYDQYAAALYGYCHWMLRRPEDAAEALQDTFVVAVAATLGDLPAVPELRPFLYAIARNECQRRLWKTSAIRGEEAGASGQPAEAGQRAGAAGWREPDAAYQRTDATGHMAGEAYQRTAATGHLADAAYQRTAATGHLADAAYQRTAAAGHMPDAADLRADAADERTGAAGRQADVGLDPEQPDLPTLIRAILADRKPREREVVELSLRHDLSDADLATALGVSWSRAHALASRARGRLEEALGALLIARTGREACPALNELLADWDGQLTEQTRDLVGWHIEQCEVCARRKRGALRPAALSGLLPLAPLPPELRERVLSLCTATTPAAVAYRRRVTRRAESMWSARFSQAIRLVSWDSIRRHPGAATVAALAVVWAMAAVSVTLLTFVGSHPASALAVRPTVRSSPPAAATKTAPAAAKTAPAAAKTAPAAAATSASAKPSPTISNPPATLPPVVPSAKPTKRAEPSPSHSPKPSKSPSPTPSKSPSPTPSPTPTPTLTPTPTPTGPP